MWTYKVLPQSTDVVDVELFREYVPELVGQHFESKAEFRTCLTQTGAKFCFRLIFAFGHYLYSAPRVLHSISVIRF